MKVNLASLLGLQVPKAEDLPPEYTPTNKWVDAVGNPVQPMENGGQERWEWDDRVGSPPSDWYNRTRNTYVALKNEGEMDSWGAEIAFEV